MRWKCRYMFLLSVVFPVTSIHSAGVPVEVIIFKPLIVIATKPIAMPSTAYDEIPFDSLPDSQLLNTKSIICSTHAILPITTCCEASGLTVGTGPDNESIVQDT